MTLQRVSAREHGIADIVTQLAVAFVALTTWAYHSDVAVVPLWKSYLSVTIAMILALATLTRHPRRSASIRLLAGGWILAAPYLLAFFDIVPALHAYLAIGFVVMAVGIASLMAESALRNLTGGPINLPTRRESCGTRRGGRSSIFRLAQNQPDLRQFGGIRSV